MFYTLSIGLSSFLLFLIEPLVSKLLLPWFGGGSSIWITSLVFFQFLLLFGYGFTHLMIGKLGLRKHMLLTGGLALASLAALPVTVGHPEYSTLPPSVHLMMLLAASIGIPYFVLSTTSPTLQYWISHDRRMTTYNPYIQYGVSNLGSLCGLLAYPFLVEPHLPNMQQRWFWTGLYFVYVAFVAITIGHFMFHNHNRQFESPDSKLDLTHNLRARWIFQAMVPAAFLIVITHYVTLDVVNLPLLWIAPLCIYLLSFIICFLYPGISKPGNVRSLVALFSIFALLVANHSTSAFSFEIRLAAAFACLFSVCLLFHGDLERSKPDKGGLTDFYLQIAAGGTLGSLAAATIAPLVFNSLFEFYVVPVVAVYYIVVSQFSLSTPIKYAFIAAILVSISASYVRQETDLVGNSIYRTRSFYSTYRVEQINRPGPPARRLVAGTHVHGLQLTKRPDLPVAYYHPQSGFANVYKLVKPVNTAVVGLGVGSVIDYGNAESHFDIYEIDPTVIYIAKTYFTVLTDSPSHLRYFVGDGRIGLRKRPDARYDLMVLDAFNSGSIPTHLATEEAIEEYLDHLNPHGAIVYNISNRRIDLLPVLNAIANRLHLWILYDDSPDDASLREYAARWVVITRDTALAGKLRRENFGWMSPPPKQILWTDEFSDIWSVMRWE